jgi:hypothetical protein
MNNISLSLDGFAEKTAIYLIREELKSRKLFGGLRDLGFDDDFYCADLLEIIMPLIGYSWDLPEHYDFCNNLLEKHSALVVLDGLELLDEAKRVYDILSEQAVLEAYDPAEILKAPRVLEKYFDPSRDRRLPFSAEMKLRERSWRKSRAQLEFIGAKLRWFRQCMGLGIESAAKRIRIPKRRLNRIERGTYAQFDVIHLRHICRCYRTSADAFIGNFIDPRFHYSQS